MGSTLGLLAAGAAPARPMHLQGVRRMAETRSSRFVFLQHRSRCRPVHTDTQVQCISKHLAVGAAPPPTFDFHDTTHRPSTLPPTCHPTSFLTPAAASPPSLPAPRTPPPTHTPSNPTPYPPASPARPPRPAVGGCPPPPSAWCLLGAGCRAVDKQHANSSPWPPTGTGATCRRPRRSNGTAAMTAWSRCSSCTWPRMTPCCTWASAPHGCSTRWVVGGRLAPGRAGGGGGGGRAGRRVHGGWEVLRVWTRCAPVHACVHACVCARSSTILHAAASCRCTSVETCSRCAG